MREQQIKAEDLKKVHFQKFPQQKIRYRSQTLPVVLGDAVEEISSNPAKRGALTERLLFPS